MKKISYVIMVIGLILILYGVYALLLKPSNELPVNTDISGKYTNSNGTIYIYQDDKNEGYFVINNEIYGKGEIGKKITSSVNGVDYEFKLDNDNLYVKTSNSIVNGSYKKERSLTLREYYNDIYGDIELLESYYNGIYKDDEMEVIIYQFSDDEVKAFIKRNNNIQVLNFEISPEGQLNSLQNDDNHVISKHDDKLLYTLEGSKDFFQKELSIERRITYKDVLELYINK